MPRFVPFVFCRYTFSKKKRPLSAEEQHNEFLRLRGITVLHRKGDDDKAEADTLTMMPTIWLQDRLKVVGWSCGYYLKIRNEASYNLESDSIAHSVIGSEGVRYTRFIAIPSLGVVAVCDKSSEAHLGAYQGIARLKSVLKAAGQGSEINITLAANQADVRKALTDWSLDSVSFTVRPFNPHPRDPGRELSALFERDGIGKVSDTVVPAAGKKMKMSEGGYIEETLGLVEHGYGQVGVAGQTSSGIKASIKKPSFSQDKSVNTKKQEEPHSLRVLVEDSGDGDIDRKVVKALLEFYGKPS